MLELIFAIVFLSGIECRVGSFYEKEEESNISLKSQNVN